MIVIATSEGIEVDGVLLTTTQEMMCLVDCHQPSRLNVDISMHSPADLYALFETTRPHLELEVLLGINQPKDFYALLDSHLPSDLLVDFRGLLYNYLPVYMRIWQHSDKDLQVGIKGVYSEYLDLYIYLSGKHYKDFSASLGLHAPKDFYIDMHLWIPRDFYALVGASYPVRLPIDFAGQPEPGENIYVPFGITQVSSLSVVMRCLNQFKPLYVSLRIVTYADIVTTLVGSGGYQNIDISFTLNSGYKNLYVTLRPNVRRASSIIPFHTMEYTHLYVSINYPFTCGWGTGYSNLPVYFVTKPQGLLYVYLHGIRGSLVKDLRIYMNKFDFAWYLDAKPISFTVPKSNIYFDKHTFKVHTSISDLYFDKKTFRFLHPRRLINCSRSDLEILLVPYSPTPTLDLSVMLTALKPMPLVMEGTQEIALWAGDPAEIVRIVDVLFEQQVYEYVWVSVEQRAYARNLWEKWCLMSRSYVPHELYAGQIDYGSIQTLCNVSQFNTIDEAIRYLIQSSYMNSHTELSVLFDARGYWSELQINFGIYDVTRIQPLFVSLEAFQTSDLMVTFDIP